MAPIQRAACGLAAGVVAALLTGCSVDAMIWGNDGAHVIQTTERLVHDLAAGKTPDAICADSAADLGAASDWAGLSAGEPEKFVADYWDEQAALAPQWSINLEGLVDGATPGREYPGDVFYRETDDGLCVIDVAWWTLVSEG
jgi:hypothetical protein